MLKKVSISVSKEFCVSIYYINNTTFNVQDIYFKTLQTLTLIFRSKLMFDKYICSVISCRYTNSLYKYFNRISGKYLNVFIKRIIFTIVKF